MTNEITKERRDAIRALIEKRAKDAADEQRDPRNSAKETWMWHCVEDELWEVLKGVDALGAAEAMLGEPYAWAAEAEGVKQSMHFDRQNAEAEADDYPSGTVVPLYAATLAAEPVKVKPLVWGRDYVDCAWYGNTPASQTGPSYIVRDNGTWCINGTGRWVHDQAGNVGAAKAAAQADYEARIRSALVSEKEAE